MVLKTHTVDITFVNSQAMLIDILSVSCQYLAEILNSLELLLKTVMKEDIKLTIHYALNMEKFVNEIRMISLIRFLNNNGTTHKSLCLSSVIELRDMFIENNILLAKVPPKYVSTMKE